MLQVNVHEARTYLSRHVEAAANGEHAISAGSLPPIHEDPSDRMLVARQRWKELCS